MNKQQQIEQMAEDLENTILGLGIHLCEKSAEKLYDLGYRKVSDNYIGTDKVLRSIDYRPVDGVRKETAREILQKVVNICIKEEDFQDGTVNTQLEPLYFGIMNGCAFVRGEVKELAKQYGVEVEE